MTEGLHELSWPDGAHAKVKEKKKMAFMEKQFRSVSRASPSKPAKSPSKHQAQYGLPRGEPQF